ncbi:MAG TPA: GDP-mannose 4,6-dehydratase, partial [Syntrophorhabdaceae bacterium]|nr:GDP-mannose 4,6-dehydratase [Syntrophorhabdaceae bacterium]
MSRYFLEYLENTGEIHQVKGIDKREPDFNMAHFEKTNLDFEKNELFSKDEVERIIGDFQPDYILHLASHSSVSFSWEEPVESFLNNTSIFLNFNDAVRKLQLNSRILSI